MQILFLDLGETQVKLPLHGFGAVVADEIRAEAGSPSQPGGRHRYIGLRVPDRVEHMARNDHDRAALKAHSGSARKAFKTGRELLVLNGMQTVSVRLQRLSVNPLMSAPGPLVRSREALGNTPHQIASQITEHLSGPRRHRRHFPTALPPPVGRARNLLRPWVSLAERASAHRGSSRRTDAQARWRHLSRELIPDATMAWATLGGVVVVTFGIAATLQPLIGAGWQPSPLARSLPGPLGSRMPLPDDSRARSPTPCEGRVRRPPVTRLWGGGF